MKHGKLILGAAALLVAAVNVMAFKAHANRNGNKIAYITDGGVCTKSTCHTRASGASDQCHAASDGRVLTGTTWSTSTCKVHQTHATVSN